MTELLEKPDLETMPLLSLGDSFPENLIVLKVNDSEKFISVNATERDRGPCNFLAVFDSEQEANNFKTLISYPNCNPVPKSLDEALDLAKMKKLSGLALQVSGNTKSIMWVT